MSLVSSNADERLIALPLLPENGAWSIFGTIFALRVGSPGASMAYYPTYSGYCTEGVARLNSDGEIPRDGDDTKGLVEPFEPGGLKLIITDLQAEIAVTGTADVIPIAWGWDLTVVLMSLP